MLVGNGRETCFGINIDMYVWLPWVTWKGFGLHPLDWVQELRCTRGHLPVGSHDRKLLP